jgi:deoxycytidylate deaminase
MSLFNIGYFLLAKNVSMYSDYKQKLGCVIAKHKPIGIGFNLKKTRPTNSKLNFCRSSHAEIRCLINCGKTNLKGSVAYIYRQTKNGKPAMARPCEDCLKALKDAGVKKIYYTINIYPYFKVEKI